MDASPVTRNASRLFLGLVVIALGVVALLNTFGVLEFEDPWRLWPLVLVVLGLSKMLGPRGTPGRFWGVVLLAAGAWFLAQNLGLWRFRMREFILPAVALLIGGRLVWGALWSHGRRGSAVDSSGRLSAFVLLGSAEHRSNAADFQGGEATAILGSCKIDLLEAAIRGGEPVIDVFALWGGVEINVPRDWSVVIQGTPILGSLEDKTRPNREASGPRLVVRAVVIMGGLEIKN